MTPCQPNAPLSVFLLSGPRGFQLKCLTYLKSAPGAKSSLAGRREPVRDEEGDAEETNLACQIFTSRLHRQFVPRKGNKETAELLHFDGSDSVKTVNPGKSHGLVSHDLLPRTVDYQRVSRRRKTETHS